MIKQYLSNTNGKATVPEILKFCQLNKTSEKGERRPEDWARLKKWAKKVQYSKHRVPSRGFPVNSRERLLFSF
jgi:hypothetical protein